MDWRDILKETVGITEEGSIVDLNDMEEREILMYCYCHEWDQQKQYWEAYSEELP